MKDLHQAKVTRHHPGQILPREVIRVLPLRGQVEAVANQLAVLEAAIFQVAAVPDHPGQVQVAAHPVPLQEAVVAARVEDNNRGLPQFSY